MPPRIDATHRGPLLNLGTWIMMVIMIISVIAKITTKWAMVRKLQRDDALMIVAMVLQ